jgi:hypothetical protein
MPENSPTALELLTAVEEFLQADVLPALRGSDRYHLQVALNALTIVGRELAAGAALDEAERQRLAALLGTSGSLEEARRMLCERIRARELGYRDPRLMQHLVATTMGKMSIDNPKYATYLQAVEGGAPCTASS